MMDGNLVDVSDVVRRKGAIRVAGRYSCSKRLEDDVTRAPQVLGRGVTGEVHLAAYQGDSGKKPCALKSISKIGLSRARLNQVRDEAEIYLSVDHPHLARLERVYESGAAIHIVMEYLSGGHLRDRVEQGGAFSEKDAARLMQQVLLSLAYLHGNRIAHRDLKLEHLMFECADGKHLKLIDLGFASRVGDRRKMSEACGTLRYIAPEVFQNTATEKVDVWSAGVIAYTLTTGVSPWTGTGSDLERTVRAGQPHYSSPLFASLSGSGKDFIRSLLAFNPDSRPSAAAALGHPWLSSQCLESPSIEPELLSNLQAFAQSPPLQRACRAMAAWSVPTGAAEDALRQQFLALADNGRGAITAASLAKGSGLSAGAAEALLQSLNISSDGGAGSGGSGEVSYRAFLAGAVHGRHWSGECVDEGNSTRSAFDRFDAGGRGSLGVEEFESLLGSTVDRCDLADLIRNLGSEFEGSRLNYGEFCALLSGLDLPQIPGVPPSPEADGGEPAVWVC